MNLLKYLLLLVGISSLTAACNKVDLPIPKPVEVAGVCVFPVVDSTAINRDFKKTYVEEFTGHKCITCPANTVLLVQQQEENKDRVIVLSVHAGGFAKVDLPDYPTDFNTGYGTDLFQHFNMATQPIPSAVINRHTFPSFNDLLVYNQATTFWDKPIDEENTNTSTDFGLGLAAEYSEELGNFCIKSSIEVLSTITGNYRILVLCAEDSVIAEQLDARVSEDEYPHKIVTDYMHRHVMRGKLNNDQSINGDPLITGTIEAGTWIDYELNTTMPSNVVTAENTHVIALIVNDDTEEVIQSEEVHVHVK
ncbi:MAG: Omp28-related outer membrane protein [Flavobacteriales bacterium]|nr:Omp28-related outer membrane protein [Flavobacteriales bacterium]